MPSHSESTSAAGDTSRFAVRRGALVGWALAVLIAALSAGCTFPNQEGASSTPAGPKLPPIEQLTRNVSQLSVPPFDADYRRVRCGYMNDALLLCSGIVVGRTGQRSDRVSTLFALDRTPEVPLRPVCHQRRYGVEPDFNIFCAV
jgi:hypothetical protein